MDFLPDFAPPGVPGGLLEAIEAVVKVETAAEPANCHPFGGQFAQWWFLSQGSSQSLGSGLPAGMHSRRVPDQRKDGEASSG